MVFAEFQKLSLAYGGPPHPIPLLGSDGTYRCDGRKSLANQIAEAIQRANYLQAIHGNQIIGVIMFRSHRLYKGTPITKLIPITPPDNHNEHPS